ncbi:HSF-type DNA-binding-domain-containing protein [Cytidiella melzeri]|nr:HSF-type DNA-binding-domain-containing protein [Cytidiella melzeri]
MVDNRPSTSLSLNLSSLTVASPTNLSPIHPSVSPITPISPSNAGLHQNALSAHHHHHHPQHHPHHHSHVSHVSQPFQFAPPDQHNVRYDDSAYDYSNSRRLTSSRSSSSSDKSVPRKRSFTSGTSLPPPPEESAATPVSGTYDHTANNGAMDTSPYDEVDMNYSGMDAEASPIDGSNSGGEQDDQLKPLVGSGLGSSHAGASSMNVLGKPIGTNNFVTKLYQMINDPKSAQFITWTELGTSFVVSNVGEFSRTILGSHFKHNNFSSFVRQLNMYGFHKINRTPRAQRTSADVQTWEFSHLKFLRGRPDLLEEIKRKALEPDPSVKHRVELPGEVAAQLSQMRDDNRRLVRALNGEKVKVDRLANVTKALYDVVTKVYGQHINVPFPSDILENHESPNILVTSPNASSVIHSQYQTPLQSLSNNPSLHSLHSLSPGSSPTAPDFPSSHNTNAHTHAHAHTPHSLSRQHSFQHVQDYGHHHHSHNTNNNNNTSNNNSNSNNALPPSPGPGDSFDDAGGRKRQRTGGSGDDAIINSSVGGPSSLSLSLSSSSSSISGGPKKGGGAGSRARSDSAPLGYHPLAGGWPTRPRSGSGLQQQHQHQQQQQQQQVRRREEQVPVLNIASVSRGGGGHQVLPMLSIPGGGKHQQSTGNGNGNGN